MAVPVDRETSGPSDATVALPGPESAADTPPLPAEVGRYRVLGVLGKGGMGTVLEAIDPELQRTVAIKLVSTRGRPGSTVPLDVHQRMLREAQALAAIAHANVVAIFDVGEHDGGVFLAMELVCGQTVREWLQQPRDWRAVVGVFAQAGRGIAALHQHGLVHRDIKPSNVIIGDDGRVRVLDLGLVRASGAAPSLAEAGASPGVQGELGTDRLTQAGTTFGTPAYMAPEQHCEPEVGPAADQYAFCVALHEALWGTRPAQLEGRLQLSRGHGVPASLHRLVARGLARRPEDRWPSMLALVAALESTLAPHRTRWLAAAGGLAAAAVVGGALLGGAPTHGCDAADPAMGGVWNADRRAAIGAAILATGLGHAASTASRIEPALTAYAEQLDAAERRACEAAPEPHEAPRRECLAGRKDALRATVEALAAIDAGSIDRAFAAVDRLPPLAECEDADVLARWVPVPPSGERERVEQIREILARGRAFSEFGRFAEALEIARQAQPLLDGLSHLPTHAEVLLEIGHLEDRVSAGLDAETTLREGLRIAQACGHDTVAVRASLDLALAGTKQGPQNDADFYLRQADAISARLGRPDNVEANRAFVEGRTRYQQGRYAESLASLERALALRRALYGDKTLNVVVTIDAIGAAQLELGDMPAAVASFERALAIKREIFGKAHPELASSLSNVGITLAKQGRMTEALAHLEEAQGIVEFTLGAEHENVGALLLNRAAVLIELERVEEGLALTERAIEVLQGRLGPTHPWVLDAQLNSVRALVDLGRLERAEQVIGALEAAEAYPDDHPSRGSIVYVRGSVLLAKGDIDGAIAAFERAQQAYIASLGADHPDLADLWLSIADAEFGRGGVRPALEAYTKALALLAAHPDRADALAAAQLGRAEALAATGGDPVEVRTLVASARAVFDTAPERWPAQRAAADRLAARTGR